MEITFYFIPILLYRLDNHMKYLSSVSVKYIYYKHMNAENMHANLVAAIMYKEVNGKGENFYLAGHYFVLQVATHMCIEPFFNFFLLTENSTLKIIVASLKRA